MAKTTKIANDGATWPLRVILGLCVSALIIVGFELSDTHHPSVASPTTTLATSTTVPSSVVTTVPTSQPTTTLTTSPTTTTPSSPSQINMPVPIVNLDTFNPPGAGCRFSTDASTDTTTTTTTVHSPAQNAPGHCTVLEVGDSLGNDLGWGLARELGRDSQLTLVQDDKSSSGLTTPWFYNWPMKESTLIAQYHPQLVVIMFGGNDEQNLRVDGHVVAFASAPWIAAYTKIVTQIATTATRTGAYVLWVGMPIMQPNGYRQNMALINSVFAKVESTTPGMTFLPTWDLFANKQHQYQNNERVNNIPSVLRSTDGIHFSYVGENVIATYVTRSIATVYHVIVPPEAPMFIDG
ncbi:MAG: DUF459 domain-containing protein [Acidimicrobiales bacterium]